MHKHTFFQAWSIVLVVLGGLCAIYGAYVYLCYGIVSFAWFFPLLGGLLLGWGAIELYKQTHLLQYVSKSIQKSLLVLMALGLSSFVVLQGSIVYEGMHTSKQQADYVIVLGAQLNGQRITRSLRYRLEAAKRFAFTYPEATIIVSGGQGPQEDISEAAAMKKWLVAHGVKASRIIIEDASTNTKENFIYSLQKIKDDTEHVSIITNGFHMKRSKMICEQAIDSCSTYPAKSGDDLAPVFYVREVFAYIKDWLLS